MLKNTIMKAIIKSSKCALMLIEIMKLVKNLSPHISFTFRESEVYIQVMDQSHICLLDVNINSEWFDTYEVSQEQIISLNVNILLKVISLFTLNTIITFNADDDGEKLYVTLNSDVEKNFEIPLMDIDFEYLQPGDSDYSCDFEMNTKVLDKYMSELMIFGEKIDFKYKNDNLNLISSGPEGSMNIKIPSESLESLCVEEDVSVFSSFDIKYISYISKLTASFKKVSISFDREFPLFCKFEEDNIKIKYFVAPKTSDDDEEGDSDLENEIVGETDF